jgi:hypothetical protein
MATMNESSIDDETPDDRDQLDEERSLAEFNAALQEAIDSVDWSQPF